MYEPVLLTNNTSCYVYYTTRRAFVGTLTERIIIALLHLPQTRLSTDSLFKCSMRAPNLIIVYL